MEDIIPPTTSEKKCTRCKEIKSLTEFPKATKNRDGLFCWCKTCARSHTKARYDAGIRKPSELARDYQLRRLYGITFAQYEEIFVAQNGVCAVCGQTETSLNRGGTLKKLAVDHDHKTGKVRALLCYGCNVALGHLNEDPERAQRLAEYIKLKKAEE